MTCDVAQDQRSIVEAELRRLETRGGKITPERVVSAASADDSPLHAMFEWDDSIAGHMYRLEQARTIIRSVRVVVTTETMTINAVRYLRDPDAKSNEQGYVTLERIANDPDRIKAAVKYEFDRADAALERAERIADALGARKMVQNLRKRLDRDRRQIEALA